MNPGKAELEDKLRSGLPLLGGGLEAVYWIGSLAHGGFSPYFSDIDVAFIFARNEPESEIHARLESLRSVLPAADRWSFFWSDSLFSRGRLPVLDQVDLLDHGKILHGSTELTAHRPSREAVRERLISHSVPYWENLAAQNRAAGWAGDKQTVRLCLYPARFAYSWETGRVCSNEDAVDFTVDGQWPVDEDLLRMALAARVDGIVPAVDPERWRAQLRKVFGCV